MAMKNVIILSDSELTALRDAVNRILADSPEMAFGAYSKREQSIKWKSIESVDERLSEIKRFDDKSAKALIFSNLEGDAAWRALGNILHQSDESDIKDFFGNKRSADAAWRMIDRLGDKLQEK